MRLAFIVSHPIQYYVPIYRELAGRIRQADERQPEVGGLRPETGDGLHGNQLIKDEETEDANVSSPKWESGKVVRWESWKV